MNVSVWQSIISSVLTIAPIILLLMFGSVRNAIAKYIAGFVQNRFDTKIEKLKSDLSIEREKYAANLRDNEQRIRILTETTLSLRSNRLAALDARRLQAVETLWAAKIATDKMKGDCIFYTPRRIGLA